MIVPSSLLLCALSFGYADLVLRGGKVITVDPDMDGIRMHTIWTAYSGFDEDVKGSIEPGKLAGLVVVSQDPLTQPPERLLELRAAMTIVDGKIAFRR